MLHRYGKIIDHRKKALAVVLAAFGLTASGVLAGLLAIAFPAWRAFTRITTGRTTTLD